MYKIVFSDRFLANYRKLTLKNTRLKDQIRKTVYLLSIDPFYPSLKSHKVLSRKIGFAWSSRVTGDLRIIWEYNSKDKLIIDVLTIGGHSGKNKVYN